MLQCDSLWDNPVSRQFIILLATWLCVCDVCARYDSTIMVYAHAMPWYVCCTMRSGARHGVWLMFITSIWGYHVHWRRSIWKPLVFKQDTDVMCTTLHLLLFHLAAIEAAAHSRRVCCLHQCILELRNGRRRSNFLKTFWDTTRCRSLKYIRRRWPYINSSPCGCTIYQHIVPKPFVFYV